MFINVQFKNRQKQFTGKIYSYELCSDEIAPKENDIIRLMDEKIITISIMELGCV